MPLPVINDDDISLFDTFEGYHTLLELDEPPDDKQQIVLDGVGECERETCHWGSHAWREKTDEGSDTDDEGG